MKIAYGWRAGFAGAELDALHAVGFGHPPAGTDWLARVEQHSLGWVCAFYQDTCGFTPTAAGLVAL